MRSRHVYGLLLLVVAFVAASVMSADAAQTLAGALEFDGVAHLNQFQCPAGNCTGTYAGRANGSLSGIADGIPWNAEIAAVPFTADFLYGDSCLGVGRAVGTGTIHAFVGGVIGTYGPVPGVIELPSPVTEVLIPFTFSWSRVGTTALITVTLDVRLRIVRRGPVQDWVDVVTDRETFAVVAFAPLTVPSADVCTGNATTTLDAVVAAVAELS
jgi:hypothetical protein